MKCFEPLSVKLNKPIWSDIENTFVENVILPCGKCTACIERKIMEWSFRLSEERKSSECCYFVTLTYNNENVPINNYGKMTLDKDHLKTFFKSLKQKKRRAFSKRKPDYNYGNFEKFYFGSNLEKSRIKYYGVGEYGTKKKRPHYHAVIFNASKASIESLWKYGTVDCQLPRGNEAMSYVAKYMYKRIFKTSPRGCTPEFSICSNGIGDEYVKKMKSFYKRNNDILYTKSDNGIQVPMSKFIRHKLWNEDERKKQIPLIKANVDLEELKSIQEHGEDEHFRIKECKKRYYHTKIKRQFKDRKDT